MVTWQAIIIIIKKAKWWSVLHWSKLQRGCRPSSPTWLRVGAKGRHTHRGYYSWLLSPRPVHAGIYRCNHIPYCCHNCLHLEKMTWWGRSRQPVNLSLIKQWEPKWDIGKSNWRLHEVIARQSTCKEHISFQLTATSMRATLYAWDEMSTYIISISLCGKRQSMCRCWRPLHPLRTPQHIDTQCHRRKYSFSISLCTLLLAWKRLWNELLQS